jgi:hypothetical protein
MTPQITIPLRLMLILFIHYLRYVKTMSYFLEYKWYMREDTHFIMLQLQ